MASSARIDELLKKFEENPRRYFAPLANEYRKAGDVERAIQLCREHLPQQPGHMSGHIVFGQALFEAGQFDESRRVFTAALALDPENLIALRHLGDIARGEGDLGAARDWYKRVLDADPRNEEIAAQLASLDADSAPPAHVGEPDATNDSVDFLAGVTPVERAAPAGADAPRDTAAASEEREVEPAAEREEAPAEPAAAERRYGYTADTVTADDALEIEHIELELDSLHAGAAGAESSLGGLDGLETSRDELALHGLELEGGNTLGGLESPDADRQPRGDERGARDAVGEVTDAEREQRGARADAAAPGESPQAAGSAFDLLEETEPAPERQPSVAESEPAPVTAAASPHSLGDQPLGLESMEFVPPSRTEQHDPMEGHLLRDEPTDAATQAAFVTETMAELYLQQGFRDEALAVYRQLLAHNPDDENLRDRVAQLESGSRSSVSVAGISDSVIEAARQRQTAPAAPKSARSFFASLAIRRPSGPPPPADMADAEQGDAPASDAMPAEPAFDEFGFPVNFAMGGETTSGSAEARADAVDRDEAPAASLAFDATDELPASAAIEPATLDYAAERTAGEGEGSTSAAAAATEGFDVVPTAELEGDRYGLAEEESRDEAATSEHEASASPASDRSSSRLSGPVDTLFGDAGVGTQDDAAASALAGAFGEAAPGEEVRAPAEEPNGAGTHRAATPTPRATGTQPVPPETPGAARQAASELSLDHVFRETPRRAAGQRREAPAFSFDQFFSDSASTPARPSSGESATPAAPTEGVSGGGSEGDIEQFNAWLEGLKRK